LVRSIDNILSGGHLHKLGYAKERTGLKKKKRVLVIDDSITVREVECRLLQNKGYEVLSAVNGIDGLNALRMGYFDLVITDVDMPRMNGIELVRLIRNDPKLNKMPVMIVSYKERAEDRLLGLEAGANYYLTKGSFNDETLLNAVVELIGQP
jgi:two-component system sensor histidine kinase and response regulator WspE